MAFGSPSHGTDHADSISKLLEHTFGKSLDVRPLTYLVVNLIAIAAVIAGFWLFLQVPLGIAERMGNPAELANVRGELIADLASGLGLMLVGFVLRIVSVSAHRRAQQQAKQDASRGESASAANTASNSALDSES